MSLTETIVAMSPGLLVGAVVGVVMFATGRKPRVDRALHVIIVGALMWGALEQLGQHTWSTRLAGVLYGWVIGSGGWAFLGSGGGWWRRGGGGPAAPWDPDPAADRKPEVEPVVTMAPSTRPIGRPDADLGLWDEFESTPVFDPDRHESTPATSHASRVERLRGKGGETR